MNITLPKKLDSPEITLENIKKIVVIGANGSGKTRFGAAIEEMYNKETHRLSAQKSLTMPSFVSTSSKEKAEYELWYGGWSETPNDKTWHENHGKLAQRWHNNINTSLLNDFDKLMVLLHTEEYEESLKFKELNKVNKNAENVNTKLDLIVKIWEKVLPHRKLLKRAGIVEVSTANNSVTYNASEMSDGERVIFYLIGETICAKPNSILIIDEPEMHLHKSITNILWDQIEETRPDCIFIYLTHNIDFASTRFGSTKIWLKSYEGNSIWNFDILDNQENLPEEIFLEILGSRKPILFVEGKEKNSLDISLYPYIFPEYTIKPLGSCHKVIEATKAFKELQAFHHIKSRGIIDRDRRTDLDIQNLAKNEISVPDVSEVENILLKEIVIKSIASKLGKNPNEVFDKTKSIVIEKFKTEIEVQALLFTKYIIRRNIEELISVRSNDFNELESQINDIPALIKAKDIFNDFKLRFEDYYTKKDYNSILKTYNQKGLLPESKVIQLCGLGNKNEFLFHLIDILKTNTTLSNKLREYLRKCFEV